MDSDAYLDGEDMIPREHPVSVEGSCMDFREPHTLSPAIEQMDSDGRPGIDHAFVLRSQSTPKQLRHVASLQDPVSGRRIDVSTTECALIVYTANWVEEYPVGMWYWVNHSTVRCAWSQGTIRIRRTILRSQLVCWSQVRSMCIEQCFTFRLFKETCLLQITSNCCYCFPYSAVGGWMNGYDQ